MKLLLIIFFSISLKLFGQYTIDSTCIAANDSIDNIKIYDIIDQYPTFQGGEAEFYKYIGKKLDAGDTFENSPIQTRVFFAFVIDTSGGVRDVCIYKPFKENRLTELELNVIYLIENMPKWKPAIFEGKRVPFRMKILLHVDPQ